MFAAPSGSFVAFLYARCPIVTISLPVCTSAYPVSLLLRCRDPLARGYALPAVYADVLLKQHRLHLHADSPAVRLEI